VDEQDGGGGLPGAVELRQVGDFRVTGAVLMDSVGVAFDGGALVEIGVTFIYHLVDK
jgi:hypothetical protein